jgi:hypothetical protein
MKKILVVGILVASVAVGASCGTVRLLQARASERSGIPACGVSPLHDHPKSEPADIASVQRELTELRKGREIDRRRLAALLDIQASLVKRVETSEGALAKMDDAQQALATLCDDYRLRIEMLSKDFQRVPESGRTSAFAESSRADSPTIARDNSLFPHE